MVFYASKFYGLITFQRAVNSYFEADMESEFEVQIVEETRKDNSTEAKRKTSVDPESSLEAGNKRLKTANTDW